MALFRAGREIELCSWWSQLLRGGDRGWRPRPGTHSPWPALPDFSSTRRATSSDKSLLSAVHHQTGMWLHQEHRVLPPSAAGRRARLLPSAPGFPIASPGCELPCRKVTAGTALKSVGRGGAGAVQCTVGLGNAEPSHAVPLPGAPPPQQGCKGGPRRSCHPPWELGGSRFLPGAGEGRSSSTLTMTKGSPWLS